MKGRASDPIMLASCVGGGIPQRLVAALNQSGMRTELVARLDHQKWRRLMASGVSGRAQARVSAMVAYPLQAMVAILTRRWRTVIATTNPFYLPLWLLATRRWHGTPIIVLVYDLYPDALDAAGRSPGRWLRRAMRAANRYVFAKADAVVFLGAWISELARARYGEPASWSVIETGAAVQEFEAAASTPLIVNVADWCAGRRLASYVGNLGQTHDWETLAGALDRLAAAGVDRHLAVLIAASGPGAASLRQATTHLSEGFVRFEPPLSDADWTGVMSNTDIALVSLRPEAAASSIPSKAFSALAAGSALVAIVPPCDISAIIVTHDCGAVVAPGDDEALAATLESLASDDQRLRTLSRNAREVAGEQFDLTRLVRRWHDVVIGIERSWVAP